MSVFKFKQFDVIQQHSAMKVGTDGVLLGSWVNCEESETILDIGCGTGLLSLMLAQRNSKSKIVAIEIDERAANEAKLNFNRSKWKNRLTLYNVSLQNFRSIEKFDLIISNPPFFPANNSIKVRDIARHMNTLNFEELFFCAEKLLKPSGIFSLLVPNSSEDFCSKVALANRFFCNRVCYVRGNKSTAFKRILMEFSFKKKKVEKDHLTIEKSRHKYTDQYIGLCKKFYLNL